MKYINIFYISIILIAVSLFLIQKTHKSNIISFYGYAENKETEINFNHSVQVKKIHVSPGQQVKKDTPLLDVVRIDTKSQFSDQQYKIDGINAERKIWQTKIEGQIKLLREKKAIRLAEIMSRKDKLLTESQFGKELYEGLESIKQPTLSNNITEKQLINIEEEYQKASRLYDQDIKNKEDELAIGNNPYESEINRLNDQKRHNENQELIDISMIAPKDGLVGNVYCKEAEHFASYKTLLSFYEPNPSMIKGFIQEDFITEIQLEDSILVISTKDQQINYYGKVIGLGSRIVEIPPRLRKRTDIKTYGREIIVSIPEENKFLQKEKTILELISSNNTERITTTNSISSSR